MFFEQGKSAALLLVPSDSYHWQEVIWHLLNNVCSSDQGVHCLLSRLFVLRTVLTLRKLIWSNNVYQKVNLLYPKNWLGAVYSYIHENKRDAVLAFMWLFIALKCIFLLIAPNHIPWISGKHLNSSLSWHLSRFWKQLSVYVSLFSWPSCAYSLELFS